MRKRLELKRKKFFSLVIFIIFNILILLPFILFKDYLFVVTSPSMSPTLNIGDLVIGGYKDPKDIKVGEKDGDILIIKGPEYYYQQGYDPIFWNYLDNNTPIIHRAIDKKKINDTWYFLTKGDNNLLPDGGFKFKNFSDNYILIEYNRSEVIFIPESEIIGVVIFVIPYVGYFKIFFPLIATVIIIFICIIIIFKLLNLKIKIVRIKKII